MSAAQFDKSEEFDRNWVGPEDLRPRVYRTQSEKDTWYACVVENEYRAPVFGAEDVVIDIGAHIGSFSYLAYRLGSRNVYAFEIDPWHYEAAEQNLRDMRDGIGLHLAAVVRGDQYRAKQYHYNGAWNAFGVVGPAVDSISLDEIIAPHEKIRFIKTDCEGGEWPALYTCTMLDRVQEINGEYHILDASAPELQHLPYPLSLDGLVMFLYDRGYAVAFEPHGPTIGNFYAKRRV